MTQQISKHTFLRTFRKPWDVCAVQGCRRPTASKKKEVSLERRRCRFHLPHIYEKMAFARVSRRCFKYSAKTKKKLRLPPYPCSDSYCSNHHARTALQGGRCSSAMRRFERIRCSTRRAKSAGMGHEREWGACIVCGAPCGEGYVCGECG